MPHACVHAAATTSYQLTNYTTTDAARGCPEWYGNDVTAGGFGPAVASTASYLAPVNGTQLLLTNFTSNSLLPLIFRVVDALGSPVTRGSPDSNLTWVSVSVGTPARIVLLSLAAAHDGMDACMGCDLVRCGGWKG